MLCYLDTVEVHPRVNNPLPVLICTWFGTVGDSTAERKNANGMLNVQRVQARTIQLTKNIFPLDENDFKEWANVLLCRRYIIPKKDTNDNYTDELQEFETPDNAGKTKAYLIYKQIPLAKLGTDFQAIEFINRNGETQKQSYVNVIGWANESDEWAESQTPEEMALINLNRNIETGAYTPIYDESPKEVIFAEELKDVKNCRSETDCTETLHQILQAVQELTIKLNKIFK